jgi:hypothetical protein
VEYEDEEFIRLIQNTGRIVDTSEHITEPTESTNFGELLHRPTDY